MGEMKLWCNVLQELNGFYIPEMTSVVCRSAEEMVRVMRAGSRQRAAGRTDMNEHSSRSHAVFLVTVETAHRTTKRIRSVYTTLTHSQNILNSQLSCNLKNLIFFNVQYTLIWSNASLGPTYKKGFRRLPFSQYNV